MQGDGQNSVRQVEKTGIIRRSSFVSRDLILNPRMWRPKGTEGAKLLEEEGKTSSPDAWSDKVRPCCFGGVSDGKLEAGRRTPCDRSQAALRGSLRFPM